MSDIPEKTDGSPRPRGAAGLRFLPALLILVGALAYYGSYWRCWFNPHDEGGTVCLVAQRLLAGERPWVDVEPSYNIGWFLPVMGIFHFTGVNYLAARAFFFALATMTALLGCGIVTRISGSRWLGLAIGWLLVLLPGSQFKDYIPLAEAANTACLILMTRTNPASAGRWFGSVFLGGVTLGFTLLVRVDLAYFFFLIWIGVLFFLFLDHRASVIPRTLLALAGAVCLAGGILVPFAPTYFYCRSEGVGAQFLDVYPTWARHLAFSIGIKNLGTSGAPAAPPGEQPAATAVQQAAPNPESPVASPAPSTPSPASSSGVSPVVAQTVETADPSTLKRAPISGIWQAKGRNKLLPLLTYAPLFSFAVFLLLAVAGLARGLWRREFTLKSAPMQWLILIGGSLTTFPQFFLFRPDRPHLSEFMPGFIIAMGGGLWLLWPRPGSAGIARRAAVLIYAGIVAVHLMAFAIFAFEHPSGGTYVAHHGRKTRFDAANGVNVLVTQREAEILTGVRDAVLQHSRPEDYVVCFPYMAGYNLMANRRTYERNVYVDNATRTTHWSDEAIQDIEMKRPAVVIIDDRKINGVDASRFSRWAAKAYAYLKQNYTRVGRFDDNTIEVFALPVPTPPAQPPPS